MNRPLGCRDRMGGSAASMGGSAARCGRRGLGCGARVIGRGLARRRGCLDTPCARRRAAPCDASARRQRQRHRPRGQGGAPTGPLLHQEPLLLAGASTSPRRRPRPPAVLGMRARWRKRAASALACPRSGPPAGGGPSPHPHLHQQRVAGRPARATSLRAAAGRDVRLGRRRRKMRRGCYPLRLSPPRPRSAGR